MLVVPPGLIRHVLHQACMQQYKALLDTLEPAPGIPNPSLSTSTSTAELKRPYGADLLPYYV